MNPHEPLASKYRPRSLDDFVGQEHLVGEKGPIRKFIESGKIPSMIFWGPPGTGKTTLAYILSLNLYYDFHKMQAVNSGKDALRKVIKVAMANQQYGKKTILFLDEIHRWNKAQQDTLLPYVEKGIITLIGATTENPSFEVIRPLLSRCQVYVLKSMEKKDLEKLLERALTEDLILKDKKIEIKETAALFRFSGGDARKLLNILQLTIASYGEEEEIVITDQMVTERLQENPAAYDKGGEMHYDIISAFIKSIRGSDPDAAIYWLARMVAGGEDPKFIARRLVISASEDIGLANPNALLLANACFETLQKIGWPEGRIVLAETTIYLATSPKSNSAYLAIDKALAKVEQTGNLPVPLHLRNAPTTLMKELDYGKEYKYSHDYENNFVKQDFMPEELKNNCFWEPQTSPAEKKLSDWMKKLWD